MCKPHSNHKAKTYSKYTKDKEKGIEAYHYRKLTNHKGRKQRRKEETEELQISQKTINKMVIVSPHISILILH